jgi:hypothetical protein
MIPLKVDHNTSQRTTVLDRAKFDLLGSQLKSHSLVVANVREEDLRSAI